MIETFKLMVEKQRKIFEAFKEQLETQKPDQVQLQALYDQCCKARSDMYRNKQEAIAFCDEVIELNNDIIAKIKEKMDD